VIKLLDSVFPLLSYLFTSRGYAFADIYIKPLPILGIGAETGFAYMTFSDSNSGLSFTMIDMPFRGFLRIGIKAINVEAYGGYYLNIIQGITATSGVEAGLRLSFSGFFLDAAYVFGTPLQYLRFGAGFAISFLPGLL
jgi:hypothetical protein